jgi:hypothetical protein
MRSPACRMPAFLAGSTTSASTARRHRNSRPRRSCDPRRLAERSSKARRRLAADRKGSERIKDQGSDRREGSRGEGLHHFFLLLGIKAEAFDARLQASTRSTSKPCGRSILIGRINRCRLRPYEPFRRRSNGDGRAPPHPSQRALRQRPRRARSDPTGDAGPPSGLSERPARSADSAWVNRLTSNGVPSPSFGPSPNRIDCACAPMPRASRLSRDDTVRSSGPAVPGWLFTATGPGCSGEFGPSLE